MGVIEWLLDKRYGPFDFRFCTLLLKSNQCESDLWYVTLLILEEIDLVITINLISHIILLG